MTMAKDIEARFIERIERTPTVSSFRFIFSEQVDFIPGQFSQIIFDVADIANKQLNKYLSFSCAPSKDYIEITKRISPSLFSQRLMSLQPGDKVLFKTPLGSCVFKPEYKKVGFLIGGIGITPVISIIEHIVDKRLDTDVHLVYSNRSKEEIAFYKELEAWKLALAGKLTVDYVICEGEAKDNGFILGKIDEQLLRRVFPDIQERVVFIFGPPAMVEAMQKICLSLGCAKEKVKLENFIGY